MLYLYNYSKLMYTQQTDKLILIDPVVFYLGISKQGAGLRSSYYHCRFFFFNRGYVIKRSIYARQYDIPPGQFIEHPRGYFHMNVTRVKIRNIEDRPGRPRGTIFPFFFFEWPTIGQIWLNLINRIDESLKNVYLSLFWYFFLMFKCLCNNIEVFLFSSRKFSKENFRKSLF